MFYDKLMRACEIKGIKITPLTNKLNISKGNIARWKQGGMPSADVLSRIAAELDCSVDFLLGNSQHPKVEVIPADPDKARELLEEQDRITKERWADIHEMAKKITSSGVDDPKEALHQALVLGGVIPSDRPVTDDETDAILAFAETLFKRSDK